MRTKIIRVDPSEDNDYTCIAIIDTENRTFESRILHTGNPDDPNSWLHGFMEETKKK